MKSVFKSAAGERAVRERYAAMLNHWPVPNRQLRLATREGETFVIECGNPEGPALLLHHGSAVNSAMWMGSVAAWAPHIRILAVDMIGEPGFSAPSRPPLSTDAHALWLDDVFAGLGTERATLVGASLGGWLAIDYATRRPHRVDSLVATCPGGVGRQKISIVFKTVPLRLMGEWGKRKASVLVLGRAPANLSPAVQAFMNFIALIHSNFRMRMVKFALFSDDALQRLQMPVMAIVGGKDVLFDSDETRRRLERNVVRAQVRYLPEAGHFIPNQTEAILDFLLTAPLLPDKIVR